LFAKLDHRKASAHTE